MFHPLLVCLAFLPALSRATVGVDSSVKRPGWYSAARHGRLEWFWNLTHCSNNSQNAWPDDGRAQMPLGNGDVTAGVWVSNAINNTSTRGDLRLLIGISSALDENSQPVKVGALRVVLDPPLWDTWPSSSWMRQIFDPITASLRIETHRYNLLVYVDANEPIVRISIDNKNNTKDYSVTASLEPYRRFQESVLFQDGCGAQFFDHYDVIVNTTSSLANSNGKNTEIPPIPRELQSTVAWYHENPQNSSYFRQHMEQEKVPISDTLIDPFRERIFGGVLYGGTDLKPACMSSNKAPPLCLVGADLTKSTILHMAVGTQLPLSQSSSGMNPAQLWLQKMATLVAANPASLANVTEKEQAHKRLWRDLWKRSYVVLSPRQDSKNRVNRTMVGKINVQIVWDRYLALIQGRQASTPIKFNGQAFTANNTGKGWDFRYWGSGYWWQNTRQPYYNALINGDVDLLDSMIDFYLHILPYVQARTYANFQHTNWSLPYGAALYPEGTTIFGSYGTRGWGCDGNGPMEPYGVPINSYGRFHWVGGLELSLLVLDRYEWTRDMTGLTKYWPIVESNLLAFTKRFPVPPNNNGTVDMFPAQSLETWHCLDPTNRSDCVTGPTPDIAGLWSVLSRAITLPGDLVSDRQRGEWKTYLQALPAIPKSYDLTTQEVTILPAQQFPAESRNTENVELYTVHPFRLYGVGKEGLAIAQATYRRRRFPCNYGWCQDVIDEAMLNLTSETARQIQDRATSGSATEFMFPGFAQRYQDYEPSLDHFATMRIAINAMLLAPLDQGSMILFPGFPSDVWDVDFRLHGPGNTTVEATCRGGEIVRFHVTPPSEGWRIRGTGNCRFAAATSIDR